VPIRVGAVRAENKAFIMSGRFIKTASLKNEWLEDVENPTEVVRILKASQAKIDLLKFWQRIPQSETKYSYYKEWRQIAAIPITNYKHWFEKQISPKARNKIRKAQKSGVVVERIELNDEFIRGAMPVYNQSSVRRGKPFWHYGKDFNTVKNELSADLERSVFVAAYYEKELIGFIRLLITDRYAMTLLILDKTAHRDKAPMNAHDRQSRGNLRRGGNILLHLYRVAQGRAWSFPGECWFRKNPGAGIFRSVDDKRGISIAVPGTQWPQWSAAGESDRAAFGVEILLVLYEAPKMRRQFAAPRRAAAATVSVTT
jgi:hypothetical protein